MNTGRLQALLVAAIVLTISVGFTVPARAATTWIVDAGNGSCDDSGPGTAEAPLCKIGAGAARALPGDTVLVYPAVYSEQVPAPSGTAGSPVTFLAQGPRTIVRGSNDLSDPATWTQVDGSSVWSRPYKPPSAQPQMMFWDTTRLTKGTGASTLTSGQWFYDAVAQMVFVDAGGPNPADGHSVEVGALSYGFQMAGQSHVVVSGFEFTRQNFFAINIAPSLATNAPSSAIEVRDVLVSETGSYGINVDATPDGAVVIASNTVTTAGSHGIRIRNSSGIEIRNNQSNGNLFSGIAVHASSDNLIVGNTAHGNAKPEFRAANGIDLNAALVNNVSVGSSNNVVRANKTYENQDSGIQVYNGSNDNLIARNVSFDNGDHGFDNVASTNTRYISNTAYRNFKDGISVEGQSTGARVANNIAVDNGLTTNEFDLFVADDGSVQGFSSDYNIFYKSGPGTVVDFNNQEFATVEDFAIATGHESHGLGADPRFVDAPGRNLSVFPGSPAIDSADASVEGFVLEDLEGRGPLDDPSTPDTGVGPPTYADRGALEFEPPPNTPPNASLTVSPRSGPAPLTVVADASTSTDNDGNVATYSFDWGDGTPITGPQTSPAASHTYTKFGTYVVTVTVIDTEGLGSTAAVPVTVADAPPVVSLSRSPGAGKAPLKVTAKASASDEDGTPVATYTFDWGDGTAATGPQAKSSAVHTYTKIGTFTIKVTATDTAGLNSSATATVKVRKH